MEDPRYICFIVENKEHSKRIQNGLFEMGITWADKERRVKETRSKSLWIHLDEKTWRLYYTTTDKLWEREDRAPCTLLLTEEDLDWCIRNKKPLQKKPEMPDGFDKVLQTINECWK